MGIIRREDNGAARNPMKFQHLIAQSPAVWACLGGDTLDMPRTSYQASQGKRSQ